MQLLSWHSRVTVFSVRPCDLLHFPLHIIFPCGKVTQTLMYMTTAYCSRVCRIFRNCVSTAVFLSYWSRQVEYDYEEGSLSHCRRVKALSITYSEFASVALVVKHSYRIFSLSHSIVVCGLSCCTIFLYIISLTARISEKIFWKWIMFSFSLKIVWNASHFKKNSARCCHKCGNVFA